MNIQTLSHERSGGVVFCNIIMRGILVKYQRSSSKWSGILQISAFYFLHSSKTNTINLSIIIFHLLSTIIDFKRTQSKWLQKMTAKSYLLKTFWRSGCCYISFLIVIIDISFKEWKQMCYTHICVSIFYF